jgi:DNA-nicking Smr family endonuclease
MKRTLRPEESKLWSDVASRVRPFAGRSLPALDLAAPVAAAVAAPPQRSPTPAPALKPKPASHHRVGAPDPIEPRRLRRIVRGREGLGPRLDLHGMDQDRARAALSAFLARAQAEGWRAVLVITGKGLSGDGVLRRRLPDWLAGPEVRSRIAGVSPAHRRDGGKGAVYIALRVRT